MTTEEAISNVRSFFGQLTEGCQESIRVLISELAPTDTLYKSLLDAVREKAAAASKRYADKKAKAKAAAKTEDPVAGPVEGMTLRRATLSDYTAQDLWNELKRRGVQVGPDGRLFIKIELD